MFDYNAACVVVVQGDAKTTHKPLYLKHYCQPDRNTLEIAVSSCCCVRHVQQTHTCKFAV